METKIKTTGAVLLAEELNRFLMKKAEKLEVFVKNDPTAIAEIEIGTISAGQHTGDIYRAEVHVTFTGGDVYAESTADTLHKAIDKAFGEARRELRKKKSKERDMVRRGASQVKDFFRNFRK